MLKRRRRRKMMKRVKKRRSRKSTNHITLQKQSLTEKADHLWTGMYKVLYEIYTKKVRTLN